MADAPQAKRQKLEGDPADFLPSSTSFERLMKDKAFFADKSTLIPFIENIRNVIFCRPSRFGKSLVLQMLVAYFDKRTNDEKFNQLFGSLWIGGKEEGEPRKTKLQGKFIILPLDFSMFELDTRNPDKLIDDFENYIVKRVIACAAKYNLTLRSSTSPADALDSLMHAAKRLDNTQVYVFIDEYDTPFNQIVMHPRLTVEQKKNALFRLGESYNSVILSTKSLQFRLFMTGILNIAVPSDSGISFSRTTFEPGWHTLSGFTEDDVIDLLQKVSGRLPEGDPRRYLLSLEQAADDADPRKMLRDKRTALERLRAAYNGYWFADTDLGQPRMYNADMVLYFVRFVLGESRFPENGELIDPNASISNKILRFAGSLPSLGGLLVFPATGTLAFPRSPAKTISMDEIMKLFEKPVNAREIFWQVLYYCGALTTQAVKEDLQSGGLVFSVGVPNAVARDEYLGTIREQFDEGKPTSLARARESFSTLISHNNPAPFLESLAQGDFLITRWEFGGSDVHDHPEASFKAILLMCINLVREKGVILQNEVRYKSGRDGGFGTYSDITLLPKEESEPGIILELKNVTVAALYPEKEDWKEKINKAKDELLKKSEDELLKMPLHDANGSKTNKTVQTVLDEALLQVESSRQKALEEHPRNGGYKAWVIIRVGLFRVLANEKK